MFVYNNEGSFHHLVRLRGIINEKASYGWTPLHVAFDKGNLDIVEELIPYSDLSIRTNDGQRALDVASTEEIKRYIQDYQRDRRV